MRCSKKPPDAYSPREDGDDIAADIPIFSGKQHNDPCSLIKTYQIYGITVRPGFQAFELRCPFMSVILLASARWAWDCACSRSKTYQINDVTVRPGFQAFELRCRFMSVILLASARWAWDCACSRSTNSSALIVSIEATAAAAAAAEARSPLASPSSLQYTRPEDSCSPSYEEDTTDTGFRRKGHLSEKEEVRYPLSLALIRFAPHWR